jgi:type II secretory ATPase GspE/PulE/Tfp pilus assembly ATPase PilB-like protein
MSSFILHPSSFILLADAFPRGPGFYFSLGKLLLVLAVYLLWVRTCWWVNEDARDLALPADVWGPAVLAAGVVGLLLVWIIPLFWVSFPLLVLLYAAPSLAYVSTRNDAVRPDQRVLTRRHLRDLGRRFLTLRFATHKAAQLAPLRFVGKHGTARLQRSRGYAAALDLVQEAIRRRATDVRLETGREEVAVSLRIDGVPYPAAPCPQPLGDAVVQTLKALAGLDPAERRKPQEGNIPAVVRGAVAPPPGRGVAARGPGGGLKGAAGPAEAPPAPESRQVTFRLTTAGGGEAEKVALRVVDRARQVTRLGQLGMRERAVEQVREVVTRPHGLFLISGPDDAGKSTTLYACLAEIDRQEKTVITVEGPLERRLDKVAHVEVSPGAARAFAVGLRSAARRAPDVIAVDDLPDAETAEAACEAAADRLVVAAVRAGDAVGGLGRLVEAGVPPALLADALTAVLGQRLVRVLCPACKQRYKPNAELVRRANLPADRIKFFYRPPEGGAPCEECGGTGYRGRVGVFELLLVTDAVRALVRGNASLGAIKQEAVRGGMTYLQEDGLRQVIDGATSIQELLRVCK